MSTYYGVSRPGRPVHALAVGGGSRWRSLCGRLDHDTAIMFDRDSSAATLMANGLPYSTLIDRGGICRHCQLIATDLAQRLAWDTADNSRARPI